MNSLIFAYLIKKKKSEIYQIRQESSLKTLTVHEINLYQQGEIFVKHAKF